MKLGYKGAMRSHISLYDWINTFLPQSYKLLNNFFSYFNVQNTPCA